MSTNVYATGPVYLSVCTNDDDETMLHVANITSPTGLDHGWQVSEDKTFATGQSNPSPCNGNREGYQHVLLEC